MNKTLVLEEYHNILYGLGWQFAPTRTNIWVGQVARLFGCQVVFPRYSDIVILFERCEYCGGMVLDEFDCCASCSAPAYL